MGVRVAFKVVKEGREFQFNVNTARRVVDCNVRVHHPSKIEQYRRVCIGIDGEVIADARDETIA